MSMSITLHSGSVRSFEIANDDVPQNNSMYSLTLSLSELSGRVSGSCMGASSGGSSGVSSGSSACACDCGGGSAPGTGALVGGISDTSLLGIHAGCD